MTLRQIKRTSKPVAMEVAPHSGDDFEIRLGRHAAPSKLEKRTVYLFVFSEWHYYPTSWHHQIGLGNTEHLISTRQNALISLEKSPSCLGARF